MPRPIDATKVVQAIIAIRDKIPVEIVQRYSFGVPSPDRHGQSMRGGLRKALREIEQAPTLDYAPIKYGEWKEVDLVDYDGHDECVRYPKQGLKCTNCFNVFKKELLWKRNYCPNCGARMIEGKDSNEAD